MQARREENPICMDPTWKLIEDIATVNITNVTETAIRFEREWKYLSHRVNNSPMIRPRPKDNTTSRIIDAALIAPELIVLAIPNEIAKTTRPTASSIATTGSKTSVTGPLALYCLTT